MSDKRPSGLERAAELDLHWIWDRPEAERERVLDGLAAQMAAVTGRATDKAA
jgi:hypothetical protein